MRSFKRICAVILGLVLLLAGLLKLMDPVGAGLVMEDYYYFFHLDFLAPAAKFMGVVFALLETLLGTALLAGVWPKVTGLVTAVVLAFFTVLTLVLWLAKAKMDCGCFGELIHLTHFQSFIKNIALCLLWVGAFVPFGRLWEVRKVKYVSFAIAMISIVAFSIYSLLNVPQMDFTPFKPGAMLMQAQATPEDHGTLLSISDPEGEYRDELLASGSCMLISVYNPEWLSEEHISGLIEFRDSLLASGLAQPFFLSAGSFPGAEDYYGADRRKLMTLNRSNGGATLVRDGVIIAKWPLRALPTVSDVAALQEVDAPTAVEKENTPRRLKLQGFLLYVFAVLLLL